MGIHEGEGATFLDMAEDVGRRLGRLEGVSGAAEIVLREAIDKAGSLRAEGKFDEAAVVSLFGLQTANKIRSMFKSQT